LPDVAGDLLFLVVRVHVYGPHALAMRSTVQWSDSRSRTTFLKV
jgi:hypothetical protein